MAKSVFHDLFPAEEAAELEMRAKLLSGINKWLKKSGLTQSEAADHLGITQARVSEIKNGKIDRFSLSMLVRLAQRTGLRPGIQRQGQIRAWLETAPFLLAVGFAEIAPPDAGIAA